MHCAMKKLALTYAPCIEYSMHRWCIELKELEMKVGRGSPAVMVRMTEEMRAWFKHKAIDNRRTLNAEILHRLEQSRKAEEAQHEKQP